jgi:putative spermidine/putrescine transport system ATP-binding protein
LGEIESGRAHASSPSSIPIVEFFAVEKSYDGTTFAVRNVSFQMQCGEFVTFLGPSGSGKTTCLMMLAGFESVTHGRILLNGIEVNNVASHKRNIGMVFQNYALFPHLNVLDNIGYPLRIRRVPKNERREKVQKALDAVRLSNFGDRSVSSLSGGQQQRVALARALVFNPHIVLMDEPLSALDKALREEMQFEIRRLHGSLHISVVYVTHDQGEALVMSDRIAVLNNGSIQQLAAPTELYDRPANAFVAKFIGENNIFTAVLDHRQQDYSRLRIGNVEVRCAVPILAPEKSEVFLMVRPEVLTLGPDASKCENCFSGHIREVVYRGDHFRIRLSALGRDDLVAKIPKWLMPSLGIEVGTTIVFGWRATDCRALAN